MTASGIKFLQKANNSRVAGWRVMREYLKGFNPRDKKPKLLIFRNCKNLLRTLPLLRFDHQSKEDAASIPHEITHAPEAMRYALMSREPIPKKENNRFSSSIYSFDIKRGTGDDYENYINY